MTQKKKVRYAVVGLGWIAQESVLPAFARAANSELAAFVSDDPVKLKKLGKKYRVTGLYSYKEYEKCLESGIDAVYIALPNDQHREFTVRAARKGIHVLCEKPMAVTERECQDMIRACRANKVRLMIAYRLHFEEGNLSAARDIRSGKIGEPRIYQSVFGMPVDDPSNVRLKPEKGGGPLYDIGIYCLNAVRAIFRAEPDQVFAMAVRGRDRRFKGVDEMTSVVLHFPGDRLATFTASFAADSISEYQVLGTKGSLRMSPAFSHKGPLEYTLSIGEKEKKKRFASRDHFAPELVHFSDCLLSGRDPQPGGLEGLADVRAIEAMLKSARLGRPVNISPVPQRYRPTLQKEIRRPAGRKPGLVHAEPPNR